MITAQYIGAMCSEYRRYFLKVSQQQIADEVGVSRELVSKFERGSNTNSLVLFWFIKHGIFDWVPIEDWKGWSGV